MIELPKGLKEGPLVVEKIINTVEEEIKHIKELIPKYEKGNIGIISNNESHLDNFKKEFTNIKNIHILTMLESQGVEFDLVCLVGIDKKSFDLTHYIDASPEQIKERKRMQKDLLYVALTRARKKDPLRPNT